MLSKFNWASVAVAFVLMTSLNLVASTERQQAQAQDIRSSLFAEADEALNACREARADVLVPKTFAEGMKAYRKAEEDLKRGRNLDGIRRELRSATSFFKKAAEGTKLAKVTLATSIKARDDAEAAKASEYAREHWQKADRKFIEAAEKLEGGDVKGAQRRSGEAEALFRDAELEAIKQSLLKETWSLLEQAEKRDVKKRAPKTLQRAQTLVNEADRMLSENRYDSDEPRSLAQEARYEAQHSIYLASTIEAVEDKDIALESLMLASEGALQRIAGSMDIRAQFEQGLGKTTEEILRKVTVYQDSLERLNSRVAEGLGQVASLEARISELEADLGGVQQERSEMAERIAAQARLREKFARVEGMFNREDARVLREGDDVIIRLTGLSFGVGKSDIEPKYFGLLTTVQKAVTEFPGSRISIEGHTDSFGGDQANQTLSQRRAEAVREYLLANLKLDSSLVDAIGYGESRPVASNETAEGRARNRRIEVIIHPQLSGS